MGRSALPPASFSLVSMVVVVGARRTAGDAVRRPRNGLKTISSGGRSAGRSPSDAIFHDA
jgi:hypothetical protein